MRGLASQCRVLRPTELQEALELLAKDPGLWIPLAGGTDLMVRFNAGLLTSPQTVEASQGLCPDERGERGQPGQESALQASAANESPAAEHGGLGDYASPGGASGRAFSTPPSPRPAPQTVSFLDISRLEELKSMREEETHFRLGALCTFSSLRAWHVLHQRLPNLIKSAQSIGARAIQNRGTLGGNIANASPAADTPPSLLAYGAQLELRSVRGLRQVPYEAFHLGYKKINLSEDELIIAVLVPKPMGKTFHFFRKVGTRQAQAIAKLSLAAFACIENGQLKKIRIGLGSLAPVPLRALHTESVLLNADLHAIPVQKARAALEEDISPIDDLRSTSHYRKTIGANILEQMLGELSRCGDQAKEGL